jgi:hypothetical protein
VGGGESLSNRYKTILRKDITMDLKKSLAFLDITIKPKKSQGIYTNLNKP